MMIQVQSGQKLELPDGSTPAQIDEVVNHFHSQQPKQSIANSPQSYSFLGQVGDNFRQGIQSGKDLLSGNYEDIGRTRPTPRTEALADKLFSPTNEQDIANNPQAYADPLLGGARIMRSTSPSDWSGALLEKFGDTPEGKALSFISGVNPVYNVAGAAVNRYVNPTISKATGIAPENLQLGELAASTLGLKNAANIQDPNIAALNYVSNKLSGMGGGAVDTAKQGIDIIKQGYNARTPEELQQSASGMKGNASALYNQMREAGAKLDSAKSAELVDSLDEAIKSNQFIPELNPKTQAIVNHIKESANSGSIKDGGITIGDLDQYRRMLGRIGNTEDGVSAGAVRGAIDNIVNSVTGDDLASGNADAVKLLNQGRAQYAKSSKFEDITDILTKADGDANKIKSGLTRFLNNSDNLKGFTTDEVDALKNAARSGIGEKLLKMGGKFGIDLGNSLTPGNTVLPVVTGVATGNPVAPAIGTAARQLQQYMARGKAENLLNTIQSGGKANVPSITPPTSVPPPALPPISGILAGSSGEIEQQPKININAIPMESIQMLVDKPHLAPYFDDKYGKGAADTILNTSDPTPLKPVPLTQPPASIAPQSNAAPIPEGVEKAAVIAGVNRDLLGKIAAAESSGNANARNPNSTATGLFQITKPTWMSLVSKYGDKYGITMGDIKNPEANALMAAHLMHDNAGALKSKLSRPPTDGEIYLAHVLGIKDATKLITATPYQNAALLFPKVAKANKAIFYDGNKPRTVSEVYQIITSKV